jgi:hypothetical protein
LKQEILLSILQLLNSCLSMPESTDAELHEVDLFREPGHYKQVNGQQHGRHPEPCHRHC